MIPRTAMSSLQRLANKHRFNAGQPADLYFWRDHVGHEIDVLYETPHGLQPIEIKSGSTFAADWPQAAGKWQTLAGDAALPPIIVFGGEDNYEREACRVMSWRLLDFSDRDREPTAP